jgi:transketolase
VRDSCINSLTDLAEKNRKIFLITADLGFGLFDDFVKRCPKQFLNVGIAEQNMIGIATGLALEGRTVFVYSLANFPTLRCLEQIRNDACYHGLNINIISSGCGLTYGALGISHHATEDIGILRTLPEMTIIAPGDNWESSQAVPALADNAGVGYIRLDRSSAGRTEKPGEKFIIGKARRLADGSDISLLCTGGMLAVGLKAAEDLKSEGISCRVVSFHTVKPLDGDEIRLAVKETGGIITLEEHTLFGGFGSAVAEYCMDSGSIPAKFYRSALRDGFTCIVGDQEYLRNCYKIDGESVKMKVRELVKG